MTPYNSIDFEPPAPLAFVTLQNPETHQEWSSVPMQLDTGADVTLIPHEAVDKLNLALQMDNEYELMGFDGTKTIAYAANLNMVFCRRTFRGKFLFINQPIGIIGRDLLNFIPLLFDGPNQNWQEQKS